MQNPASVLIGIFSFSLAFVALIFIFVAVFVNFEEIQEHVRGFFENRAARKVAKKLNIVDKGKIPSSYEDETDQDGSHTQKSYRTVHTHCRSTVRVAISNKKAVRWCHVCELIFRDDEDEGGGNSGEDSAPDDPVPPGVKIATDTFLNRIRNRDSTKDVK